MSNLFGILNLKQRGSVREAQVRGELKPAGPKAARAKSSDKSDLSRQRGSTKSRNALYLDDH